ncbi:MAG: hypothetical protein IPO05_04640 [Flavobacteriales bacterium]|nr:hypothetical protein [Flavobacteriales bacterium]
MAHALEVRTPFLDKRVVELAFALAPERKLHKGSGKHLLRTTFGHLLPATVMSRSKKGFEVPLLALFNGPLRSFLDSTLTPVRISAAGLSVPAVEQVVRQLRSVDPGTAEATLHAIIVYIMVERWKRTDRPLQVRTSPSECRVSSASSTGSTLAGPRTTPPI